MTLKCMFNLAMQAAKLLQKPHIPFLKENNVRVGFFERDQFVAVVQRLPKPYGQPRHSRTSRDGGSTVRRCRSNGGRSISAPAKVRLDPGRTKNGEGRTFSMMREPLRLLEVQRAVTEGLQRRHIVVCQHVFHRDGRGREAEGGGLLNGNPLSTIFVFPRKSFPFFYFPDRASWRLLAVAPFCRLPGTISGTVQSSCACPFMSNIDNIRYAL